MHGSDDLLSLRTTLCETMKRFGIHGVVTGAFYRRRRRGRVAVLARENHVDRAARVRGVPAVKPFEKFWVFDFVQERADVICMT